LQTLYHTENKVSKELKQESSSVIRTAAVNNHMSVCLSITHLVSA